MSTQTESPVETTLMREVSIPAFLEKVASDAGLSPPGGEAARDLINLGDVVVPAVHRFINKQAAAVPATQAQAVKAAADTAFAVAGVLRQQPQSAAPASFLAAPGVREAAASIVAQAKQAQAVKAAAEGVLPMKEEEEEEEGKEKKKPVMPATCA